MNFHTTILGSSAAMPAFGRNQTSQVVNHHDRLFLLDCGEGTQLQFQKYKIRSSKIGHIFISHLHGDHWFGLAGLLCSFGMSDRTEPLHLFAPAATLEILTLQFKYSHTVLQYPVLFQPIEDFFKGEPTPENPILWEDNDLQIKAIPMKHSLPCWGFSFEEKPQQRKIIKEKLPPNLPYPLLHDLKNGKNIEWNNETIANESLTTEGAKPKKYVFCSDTVYNEAMIHALAGADLLYHEATYMEDKTIAAQDRMHSTAAQAASIAHQSQCKKLLIGHFSARYRELDGLLQEAQAVFPATQLATEGESFEV